MKRLTTLICCLAFMVAGVSLAISGNSSKMSTSTIRAATTYDIPKIDVSQMQMPLDLLLDQAKKNADSLNTAIQNEPEVTKAEDHVVKVPVIVEKKVEVPVLYIATPADNKGDPPDSSYAPYEVHKLSDGGIGITIPSSLGVEPYEE